MSNKNYIDGIEPTYAPQISSDDLIKFDIESEKLESANQRRERERWTWMPTIYLASKSIHAPMWKQWRDQGYNIISTWIDEAGDGESESMEDLWMRCIDESSRADYLIAYHEPGEIWKGAFVEIGAALASGKPVVVVGEPPGSWIDHPNVTVVSSVETAFSFCILTHSLNEGFESEQPFLDAIDNAFKRAADVLELVGVLSEEDDPEEWNAAFERVSHCGTCTVNAVMEVVWPQIEQYIGWVRNNPGQVPS